MHKHTANALERSIKHWSENVAADTPPEASVRSTDCALCQIFACQHECGNCPVKVRTGEDNCYGTPYYAAADALDEWKASPSDKERKEDFRNAAQAELDFLISLRVETEENTA